MLCQFATGVSVAESVHSGFGPSTLGCTALGPPWLRQARGGELCKPEEISTELKVSGYFSMNVLDFST